MRSFHENQTSVLKSNGHADPVPDTTKTNEPVITAAIQIDKGAVERTGVEDNVIPLDGADGGTRSKMMTSEGPYLGKHCSMLKMVI